MKILWFAALIGLLAGCSSADNFVANSFTTWDTQFSDVEKHITQLRAGQITPVSLQQLDFQRASLDGSNLINITGDSPVVHFPEGNSFVTALLLPEHISRFTISLKSVAGRTVFVPSVIFLNEDLQQVARLDNPPFNPKGFFLIEKQFMAETAQAIRYILIYSKDSDLDGKSEIIDVAREYEASKGLDLPEQSFPKLYAKHSPIGHLDIHFKDLFYSAQAIHNQAVIQESKENAAIEVSSASMENSSTILTDTEAFYLQQISKAVKAGDDARATSLVAEAQRAGSTKAKLYYLAEREKYN